MSSDASNNNATPATTSSETPNTESSTAQASPRDSNSHKGSSFGMGFIFGLAFSLLLAAYPLYLAFFSQQDQQQILGQTLLDGLQMQITLAYKELDSVNRQLAMIAEAEAKYQALVEQKFDLETTKTHLTERIAKLETGLAEAEQDLGIKANRFDKITESMRLE